MRLATIKAPSCLNEPLHYRSDIRRQSGVMISLKTTKIDGSVREENDDLVAVEAPLTLNLNKEELVTLLCTPTDLKDLVRGFLFTSGLIRDAGEIVNLTIVKSLWTANVEVENDINFMDMQYKRVYTTGCGRGVQFYSLSDVLQKTKKIESAFSVKSDRIKELVSEFQQQSGMYKKTGGVHSAALTNNNSVFVFREDIGRHNAIDKVVGSAISESKNFEDTILLTSGRISSEVIFKAAKCGIPIVVSRSAVTNQAVMLSKQFGITLIGFARGRRMNIYSAGDRIV